MSSKKVFKWWWGWNPNRIEQYLEIMALSGWRLIDVSVAQVFFSFVSDESKKVRYCMDYNNRVNDEYITIIKDDGWNLVNKTAGWLMWQKEYTDIRPSLFTDNESFIARNNRLLRFLFAIVLIQFPIFLMNIIDKDDYDHKIVSVGLLVLYLVITPLFIYAIAKLILTNHNLKKQGRR
jgi:hypothetical protein